MAFVCQKEACIFQPIGRINLFAYFECCVWGRCSRRCCFIVIGLLHNFLLSPEIISQKYEEIVANMTKPLGITIEASTDEAELVYITSVGEQVRHKRHGARSICMHIAVGSRNPRCLVRSVRTTMVKEFFYCITIRVPLPREGSS